MIRIDIKVYMEKSKVERQGHLKIEDPCVEVGGKSGDFRGLLAFYLGTTIPSGRKVHLCHACNNAKCSNPVHLYWGTGKENMADANLFEIGPAAAKKRLLRGGVQSISAS